MKLSEVQQELIQKYLSKTLAAKDQVLLEKEKSNPLFREALMEQAKMLRAVEISKDNELKDKFRELDKSIDNSDKGRTEMGSKKSNSKAKYFILAALLVATLFVAKHFLSSEAAKLSPQQQYAQLYQLIPGEVYQRGQSNTDDELFQQAMDKYLDKDYAAALLIWESKQPSDSRILMYKASCQLELGQYKQAESLLKELERIGTDEQKQVAEWYLLMEYLRNEQSSAFDNYAKKILSNPAHLFLQQYKELQTLR